MEPLFERHTEYLADVPTAFERELMQIIDWDSRLILIRGPKGVGKSTLMQQYVLKHYDVHIRSLTRPLPLSAKEENTCSSTKSISMMAGVGRSRRYSTSIRG